MQNIPSALAIGVLTLTMAIAVGGNVAPKIWITAFACFSVLSILAHLDGRNMVRLRVSRWFPLIVFMTYCGAIALCVSILEPYVEVYTAIYIAIVCVALADYAAQQLVGSHLVTLMGKDHLSRPGKSKSRGDNINY